MSANIRELRIGTGMRSNALLKQIKVMGAVMDKIKELEKIKK